MMTKAEKATVISIFTGVFLLAWQAFMAYLSDSIALLADAWHSGINIATSLIVLVGIKLGNFVKHSSDKTKKWFIYIENFISIIIGILIGFTAYSIFQKARYQVLYETFYHQYYEVSYLWLILPGTAVSILITHILANYKLRVGRETNTYNLIADGLHSWADVLSSIVVFIGLLGYLFNLKIEVIAAYVVSIFILKNSIDVLFNGIRGLVKKEKVTHEQKNWTTLLREKIVTIPKAGPVIDKCLHYLYPGKIVENIDFYSCIGTFFHWLNKNKKLLFIRLVITSFCFYVLFSSVSIINLGSVAYKVRFGECINLSLKPGLHFKFPYPIEQFVKIKPDSLRRIEIGYRSRLPEPGEYMFTEPNVWETIHSGLIKKYPDEAIMMTGDEYLLDFNLVIHYQVRDIYLYYFTLEDGPNLVRYIAMDIARDFVGKDAMEDILTEDREKLEQQIFVRLQQNLDHIETGIRIIRVCLQDVHPPIDVVPSFREVASAIEDRAMMINKAEGYKNYEIPVARGRATKIVTDEEKNEISLLHKAKGESKNFTDRVKEYKKAPYLTKTRLYMERMEDILGNSEKIITDSNNKDKINVKQLMILKKFLDTGVLPNK